MVTPEQLRSIMPHAGSKIGVFAPALSAAMDEFQINTPARQAAFLSQIAHESGELRYVAELASGAAYEGRADLGNAEPGDGVRYKGRGLIQITGRANYRACGAALGAPLEDQPELLEQVGLACSSAAWWWWAHGLNALADAGDFERITRRINGGLNGEAERLAYWGKAKGAIA